MADSLLPTNRILRGPPPGDRFRRTVSIGVVVKPPEGTTPGQLLQLADKALYRAKQSGRNRTVTYSGEPMGMPSGTE